MDTNFSIRMPPDIQSVTVGEHQVILIDNFLQDPHAMVQAATQSPFAPYPGAETRKGYPGIRAPVPAEYSSVLTELLEPLIKLNFNVPEHLALRKTPCAFSLTTIPPQDLGPLQCTPHFDASTPHYMAVLLYLCDEHHGGTGFYRHNATGLQQITEETRERYFEIYYDEINRERPAQRYFDDSTAQFSFLGMIPARFNRLVVYRGSLLHSACVNPQISLSSDPLAGRLTVNTFYDF